MHVPNDDASGVVGLAIPLPKQVEWQDLEVGVIFHFDLPLYADEGYTTFGATHRIYDPARYNPSQLDTDQWLAVAKSFGARYAIFTATHHNGFLQWQSDLYPYGVKQAEWKHGKGDLVKDFVESCHRYGVKPGLYLSCFRNAWWKVDNYRVRHGKGGQGQVEFAHICESMVEELCTRYGDLVQIWFDAGLIAPENGGPDVLPIVDKYQPNMIFYHSPQRREHRWIGNEAGYAGYPCWATMPDLQAAEKAHKTGDRLLLEHGDPKGTLWSPGMVDTVLRNHHWFWNANEEHTIESVERLMAFYYESVGRNCNLVLGLTPDLTGLIPEPDIQRCQEFGSELRKRFSRPVGRTEGTGHRIAITLPEPAKVNHIVIMEDIRYGERIRKYSIEGLLAGNRWEVLCEGISVGHKRIQRFEPVEVAEIRLCVSESVADPIIREFTVYEGI